MHHFLAHVISDFTFDEKIKKTLLADYLCMARVSKELGRHGDVVEFCLIVMNIAIQQKVETLATKYDYKGQLDYFFIIPDYSDYKAYFHLLGKQPIDRGGLLILNDTSVTNKTKRRFARAVGKRCFRRYLNRKQLGMTAIKDKFQMPAGINWAFYGTK